MMHKVLSMAMEELGKDDTKRHIREHLVHPMIKLAYEQALPYLLAIMTVIIAILLVSLLSLALSSMFYFRRTNLR